MGLIPRGTVLYLPCDDDLRDKSGSNNDGFFFNGAPYFDRYGVFRSCLRMNWSGQGSQYIHSTVTPISDTTEWTIAVWFYLSDLAKTDSIIFAIGDWINGFGVGLTSDEGYGISPYSSSPYGNNQYISFFNTASNHVLDNTYAEFALQNAWYFIVARRVNGVVSFFVNGQKLPYVYTGDMPSIPMNKGYYLGGMPTMGYSVGKVDELYVCNVGLTDEEVLSLYCSFTPLKFTWWRRPATMTFVKGQPVLPKPVVVPSFAKLDARNRIGADLVAAKKVSGLTLMNNLRRFVAADVHEWGFTHDIEVVERITAYHEAINLFKIVESVPREWMAMNSPGFNINPILQWENLNRFHFANIQGYQYENLKHIGFTNEHGFDWENLIVRRAWENPRTMAEATLVRDFVEFLKDVPINKKPFSYINTVLTRASWKGNPFGDFARSSDSKRKLTQYELAMTTSNKSSHQFNSLFFDVKQEYSRIVNMMMTSVRMPKHVVLKLAQTPFADVKYRNRKITASANSMFAPKINRWKAKDNTYNNLGERKYGDQPLYNSKLAVEYPVIDNQMSNIQSVNEHMADIVRNWTAKRSENVDGHLENRKAHDPVMMQPPEDQIHRKEIRSVAFSPAPTPAVKDLKSVKFNADPNVSDKALNDRTYSAPIKPMHGFRREYITSDYYNHRKGVDRKFVPSSRNHFSTKGSFETSRDRALKMAEKQWLKRPNTMNNHNKTAKANFLKYVDKKMKLSRDVSERFGKIKRFLVSCTPWKKES